VFSSTKRDESRSLIPVIGTNGRRFSDERHRERDERRASFPSREKERVDRIADRNPLDTIAHFVKSGISAGSANREIFTIVIADARRMRIRGGLKRDLFPLLFPTWPPIWRNR